jgi:hypothetical protein
VSWICKSALYSADQVIKKIKNWKRAPQKDPTPGFARQRLGGAQTFRIGMVKYFLLEWNKGQKKAFDLKVEKKFL